MKKTILLPTWSVGTPKVYFWKGIFEQHFNVVQMKESQTFDDFDPKQCIVWGSSVENILLKIEPILDKGFPVVLEYLWDHFGYSHHAGNVLLLRSNNFILANEHLTYKDWGYPDKEFKRDADKLLLCLMHLQRDHRDKVYERISKYADASLISYMAKGIQIPGDAVRVTEDEYIGSPGWQRYLNTDWYNKTNFSLVVETSVFDPRFYSEKILKPFAFKHPFIVWGPRTILGRMKELGFESFDHIVDESYDSEIDNEVRLDKILTQVDLLHKEYTTNKNFFSDALTLEKLEHNYNLFYDRNFVNGIIAKEIMAPLLEFAYGQ